MKKSKNFAVFLNETNFEGVRIQISLLCYVIPKDRRSCEDQDIGGKMSFKAFWTQEHSRRVGISRLLRAKDRTIDKW
jgi:hypothetical protein